MIDGRNAIDCLDLSCYEYALSNESQKIVKYGYTKILSPEMKHYTHIVSYLANRNKNILLLGSNKSGKSTVIETVFEQRETYLTNHVISLGLDTNS